jgi:hypothetical protein
VAEMRVDHADIHRMGGRIGSMTEGLAGKVQAFQGELAGFGEPWGGDDIGALIGGCYNAVYELFMECVNDNLEGLGEQGEGVKAMAATYRESEDVSEIEVNNVA